MKLGNNGMHGGGGVSEGELVKDLGFSAKEIMAVKAKEINGMDWLSRFEWRWFNIKIKNK